MIEYDPFSDEVMRDPWPSYARLRAESPVHYVERYDTWFLSRFEDIRTATTQDLFSAERGVTPEMVLLKAPPPPDPVFSMLDLPRQRDYRRMFVPSYTRRSTDGREASIRARVRALLAPLLARGAFDVYRDLANPLAAQVIGDLIGLPPEEALPLRELVEVYFRRTPGQVGSNPENQQAQITLLTRVAQIIHERMQREERGERHEGPDDHIAQMLRTPAEGKALGIPAMTAAVFTLLVTGAEVVPLAVANTAFYLWRHPEQRRACTEDPSQIPHAFAESLRYDQPTNLLGRVAKETVEIRGQRIRAGQGVMFLWASGNRDEAEFERADVFDTSRRPKRSLSYGHGAHKCIGEHLGNLEGRILLEELLAAVPEYQVDEAGAERCYSEFLHGFHRMPIEL